MKAWMKRWFPIAWPDRQLRLQVAAGYGAIDKVVLADIAMRNFLFEAAPDGADLHIIEGRRRAASEIFQMARVHPTDVADITVSVAPRKRGADHD